MTTQPDGQPVFAPKSPSDGWTPLRELLTLSPADEARAYARGIMELSGLLRRALVLLGAPPETVDPDGDMAHVAWWLSQREATPRPDINALAQRLVAAASDYTREAKAAIKQGLGISAVGGLSKRFIALLSQPPAAPERALTPEEVFHAVFYLWDFLPSGHPTEDALNEAIELAQDFAQQCVTDPRKGLPAIIKAIASHADERTRAALTAAAAAVSGGEGEV